MAAGNLLDWESQVAPPVQAPEERVYPGNSEAGELQRRTGAAGFIRSGAVKDNLAVPRNLMVT